MEFLLPKKKAPKLCLHQSTIQAGGSQNQPTLTGEPKANQQGNDSINVLGNSPTEPDQIQQKTEAVPLTEEAKSTACTICKEEQRAARRYRWKLIAGLFLPFTVQALDTTIIASAFPFIASEFQVLDQLYWIILSFNLTSATFIPAWGQYADIFGRHAALQAALLVMLVGSVFCSVAPSHGYPMLLVGRALQGVGCAGLNILAKVILADKVTLKENAKNNSIFSFIGGLGYGLGPLIGGYLTSVNWRLCFIINIPIAVLGMLCTFFILRPELLGPRDIPSVGNIPGPQSLPTFKMRLSTIDFGGQALFLFGMGMIVIALTWGGSYYPWSDVKVLAPLIIGTLLFTGFLVWEYLMLPGKALSLMFPRQKAMVPFQLVWSRNSGLLFYINFVTGMALFSVFYFVDLYFTLVRGEGASQAGLQLVYYTPGLGVGVYLAMFFCNVWPGQTWFPLALGTIIEPTGIIMIAVAVGLDHEALVFGMLALSGVGTGIRFMPGTLHGVGYYRDEIAAVVSLMSLALSIGGVFAMTIMFTVFYNSMGSAGLHLNAASSSSSLAAIGALGPSQLAYLRDHAKTAIALSFYAMSSFLWLGVIASACMGNVNILKQKKSVDSNGELNFTNSVVEGSYLGSLLRRRNRARGEKDAVGQVEAVINQA